MTDLREGIVDQARTKNVYGQGEKARGEDEFEDVSVREKQVLEVGCANIEDTRGEEGFSLSEVGEVGRNERIEIQRDLRWREGCQRNS